MEISHSDKTSNNPGAKSSKNNLQEAKVNSSNPIERKLGEVVNMIVDLKKDIKKTDSKVKVMDAQQEVYLNATTFKLKESVHKAVGEAFVKIEGCWNKNVENIVDKKKSSGKE